MIGGMVDETVYLSLTDALKAQALEAVSRQGTTLHEFVAEAIAEKIASTATQTTPARSPQPVS